MKSIRLNKTKVVISGQSYMLRFLSFSFSLSVYPTAAHTHSLWWIAVDSFSGCLCSLMLLTAPNGTGRPCVIGRPWCLPWCLSLRSQIPLMFSYSTTNPLDPTTHAHTQHNQSYTSFPPDPWMAAVCSPWCIAPVERRVWCIPVYQYLREVIIMMSSMREEGLVC